jgi:hypothetical protein
MDKKDLAYWIPTGLFALALVGSGLVHLARVEAIAESMSALGYPLYVMTILGVAKLLGVTALVTPGRPLLKEWAYAGFTFHLLGATASHLFVGDSLAETLPPVVLLGLMAASYHQRPASRRLAVAG